MDMHLLCDFPHFTLLCTNTMNLSTLSSFVPPSPCANISITHGRCRIISSTPLRVSSKAKESSDSGGGGGNIEKVVIVGGLVAAPVIGWSLYTLKTTGCGLPPGPGGSIGALEGVSYLVVLSIVTWSSYTKVKTGSGLPAGPFGLLGAVEGLSFLSLLAIFLVFGLQFIERGYIPGALPSDQCFG